MKSGDSWKFQEKQPVLSLCTSGQPGQRLASHVAHPLGQDAEFCCSGSSPHWALLSWLAASLVLIAALLFDRKVLLRVDYALLLTFVGFFLFVGNLGRLPAFRNALEGILLGHEVICSVVASQAISNVPAALLLSGFTEYGRGLLIGTNLGGLGTLIASMASLISYKYVARTYPGQKGRYLLWFTAANLIFLAALLALQYFLGGLS